MTNPLLDTSSLPRFDEIRPRHVLPAVRKVIDDNRARLHGLLNSGAAPDIEALVAPVEQMDHELGRVWSPVSHLQSVLGSTDWRDAYKEALPLLTEYGTELSQNADLQRAYAEVQRNLPDDASAESRSAVDHALRDFHLAGVDLGKDAKDRFKTIMQELAEVQATFEHNVQDASDDWTLNITDVDNLRGLPGPLLARAAESAEKAGIDGWLLSLDFPTYDAVMKQADSRDLREALYRGWVTRGSDKGRDPKWDNGRNIERILALRHEAANLVGFQNFAEYSLATKMADTPGQVIAFLRELSSHSRAAAERELSELTGFAGAELEAWDVGYWLEKFKQDRFSVSNEELRGYFPATTVKAGLFDLASQLYGVALEQDDDVTAWHDDVRFYKVRQEGEIIGGFYTDLFARNGKRTGAWIDECVTRQYLNGRTALPVGYLVCNFQPPDENGVSLLTHDDVVTLFHEFGHMLHHLLTRVGFPSISGINGVPWDAVELPSQFMENFAWSYEVLMRCSSHYEFHKPLPRDLFDKLDASRHAGAALAMPRQLELGLFDFRIHAEYDPADPVPVLQTLAEVRDEVALIRHPDINRLPHAFSHVFSGGYAAGYYSYKWAEVLAADAFGAFEEAGIFDRETAQRFRREILEVGGSRDIMEAYVAFRGREPTVDALLRQTGIEV
ncbi:MAG: M3 family metallopeptidase [Proteobacteria bacterium]|nr:M3 family metallopeptidase [Pseudomonadota bacterium]